MNQRILIDIKHPAQLNLFKGLAADLKAQGWDVTICYLNRGKLPRIIRVEYPGFHTVEVGASRGTKWSIIWDGNIKRFFIFMKMLLGKKHQICVSASSFPLALAGWLLRVPVIQFYDDVERGMLTKLNAFFSSQIYFPPLTEPTGKISIFNCLKEWSYLSPARFRPNVEVLAQYGLKPREYVFVREVSNKSFNYYNQQDGIVCSFAKRLGEKETFLLSLEDKSIAKQFPSNWKLLEEPIDDIHSLMYFSRLVISSGDSMAREGAMLGVPAIYCGIREMKANSFLMKYADLSHLVADAAVPKVLELLGKPFESNKQSELREYLLREWDDMTLFMMNQINHYKKAK